MGWMRVVGGSLLVAGTTIGGAMLALPVTTGLAGFFPALILFAVIWLLMMYTAFLFLETNIAMKGDINLITMAHRSLGRWGEIVAWIFYLLLLYCLTAAFLTGCGAIFLEAMSPLLALDIPTWVGPIPFVLFFGTLIYLGIKSADYINRLIMFGLLVTYLILIIVVSPYVSPENLLRVDMQYLLPSITVAFTSFGFHIIIPSLVTYLHRDLNKIRVCLIIGSILPFVVYVIWELLILGAVPLIDLHGKSPAALTETLIRVTQRPGIGTTMGLFSLFAIVTTFLGVSLSLSDFLRDGLKIKATRKGRLLVVALTLLPPLLFAWFYPNGFILALSYAGINVVVLLGFLPIAMVWADRYVNKRQHPYRIWGGKPVLSFAFIIFVAMLALQFVRW